MTFIFAETVDDVIQAALEPEPQPEVPPEPNPDKEKDLQNQAAPEVDHAQSDAN